MKKLVVLFYLFLTLQAAQASRVDEIDLSDLEQLTESDFPDAGQFGLETIVRKSLASIEGGSFVDEEALTSLCKLTRGYYFNRNPRSQPCLNKFGIVYNPLQQDSLKSNGVEPSDLERILASIQKAHSMAADLRE